ncbi:tRNA preQ1(34) S-adenosylmethionine ribosyltransferase-isomerase QueA [Legionella israelensis]|uniref:tRNA preQ1(34) S-adenosylmethionine ribosyltransferase-isomerase QueA n=1 Tax=Legionella israelensis TaxID=454 RepID=UPI00117C706E|nr:tRNA preQ1(34) S-adenosylmethionine ribosyltransferase-isomerase QueA [Legionella israelensis]QDP72299.1 tRNA preQ1(34) S-adenosylmethionine ribosyltransferase-isomerase QueA [Legionella israelensis]
MKKQDFYFDLPPELIAQYPLSNRSDSRLLTYSRATGEYGHHIFKDLPDFLRTGDVLIMNDSKVIPARLYGHKTTGGKIELLVERIVDERTFLAHIKTSKAPKPGSQIRLDHDFIIEIAGRQDDLFVCVSEKEVFDVLYQVGHIPLPPYITRREELLDEQRYQTIYARKEGSVAAPTAGLHFDESIISRLIAKGIHIGYLTLHVGAGTFRPVRCENIKEHKMHSEHYSIDAELCSLVNQTRARGGRIIAVGTTAMRTLESAADDNGLLHPRYGETDIFIYPGYKFKICNGLITNFHLPESTLLMLVSAFIGHKTAMALYKEAIEKQYRFFSYGDTSLLL